MSNKIKVSMLADAIVSALQSYTEATGELVATAVNSVSKETVQDLKRTSPKLTGEYKKHWTSKVAVSKNGRYVRTVYSSDPEYRLTHLLEYGHAKTGGGRVSARAHVRPAETRAKERLEARILEVLK